MIRHVPQVSVEEFIDGEEFTYDTICAGGQVLVENICQYHPRPLITKMHEWVSPVTVALRDLDEPGLQGGRTLGTSVIEALGFDLGSPTWSGIAKPTAKGGVRRDRRPAAGCAHGRRDELRDRRRPVRPGRRPSRTAGSRLRSRGTTTRPASSSGPAAPAAFALRRPGPAAGRIRRVRGRHRAARSAPRRDWRATLIADRMVIVRHPELAPVLEMTQRFAADLRLYDRRPELAPPELAPPEIASTA